MRSFQETYIDFLNLCGCQNKFIRRKGKSTHVGEWNLELDLELHETGKCHIFDDNWNTLGNQTLTNTNFQLNLPVMLVSTAYTI